MTGGSQVEAAGSAPMKMKMAEEFGVMMEMKTIPMNASVGVKARAVAMGS